MIDSLNKAVYRGVDFHFVSSSVEGGKKHAKHVYIGTNKQKIDEFGVNTLSFSVIGYIAETTSMRYYEQRDKLIKALDEIGVGLFIHPTLGPIDNVVAVSYTFEEDLIEAGFCNFTIQFEISNTGDELEESNTTVSEVKHLWSQSGTVIEAQLAEGIQVDARLLGSFDSALAKVQEIGNAVEDTMAFVDKTVDQLDIVSNAVSDFQDSAANLALAPQQLATAITNVFESVNAAFATADAAFAAYINFFGFGFLTDIELRFDTFATRQAISNRNALNNAINAKALTGAYLAMASKEYDTVDDIDTDVAIVEEQLELIVSMGSIDSDVYDSILEVRQSIFKLLNEKRLVTNTIVTIDVDGASARSLSFQYYGTTDEDDNIRRLNGGLGIVMSGDVRMLSK